MVFDSSLAVEARITRKPREKMSIFFADDTALVIHSDGNYNRL